MSDICLSRLPLSPRFVLTERLHIEISFFLAYIEKLAVALVMSQRWNAKSNSDGLVSEPSRANESSCLCGCSSPLAAA